MRVLLLLSAILFGSGIVRAEALPEASDHSERLLRRILAPREVIDLQGEWRGASAPATVVGEEPISMINGKTYARKRYAYAAVPSNAVWKTLQTPFVERNDVRSHLVVRRRFSAPALKGRRAILRFECIEDAFVVTVNGRDYPHMARPAYGLTTVFDVTDSLREGENELAVDFRFVDFPNCQFLSRRGGSADIWGGTRGIRGPVQIELTAPVYVTDVFVRTFVTGGVRLEAEVTVTNTTAKAVSVVVSGSVEETSLEGRASVPPQAAGVIRLAGPYPTARLWTPDTPTLYHLDVRLACEPATAVGAARACDALRQRFGFRELSLKNQRLYLNGIPFMARSGWALIGKGHAQAVSYLKQFKARGFNAMRLFVGQGNCAEVADVADEVGVLSMIGGCTENGGGGWDSRVQNDGRFNDVFWANYDAFNLAFVKDYRNHPGVICWSLGCEFGAVYCGMGSGREQVTSRLICRSAEKICAIDSTRPWCENGGIEVGSPVKGPGPCPLRSFHYPVPLNMESSALPDVAYWYPDGVVPWQRVAGFDKPTIITEDCYHGMQDSFRAMSRFAGDSIYTVEGYRDALRKGFNLFAEGYYAGGLAWWEPWMPRANVVKNALFDDYEEPSLMTGPQGSWKKPAWQCIPEWMIALRPFFVTLEGGCRDVRTLSLYNQTFTLRTVELERIDRLGGKELHRDKETLELAPGGSVRREIELSPPAVNAPTAYTVTYLMRADGETLAERTFSFTVFPKDLRLGKLGNIALLRGADSPLTALDGCFGGGAGPELAKLLAPGRRPPRAIVVAKPLSVREGKAIDDFVAAGGKALVLAAPEGAWSPVEPLFGKTVRQGWRRRASSLAGFPPEALQCWRNDDIVAQSVFSKDGKEDSLCVDDCGLSDGLCGALTTWLFRGKGSYLLTQVPVLAKWDCEIAARHYFAALCGDLLSRRAPTVNTAFALWSCASTNRHTTIDRDIANRSFLPWRQVTTCGPSYEAIFRECGILPGSFTNALDEAQVVFMDGSHGLSPALLADVDRVLKRRGTTVIVSELPEDSDPKVLYEIGCQMRPTRQWLRDAKGQWLPEKRPHPMGEFPWWIVPEGGVLSGLTGDDFLWHKDGAISDYMDFVMGVRSPRIRRKHDDSLMTAELALFEDGSGKALSTPCAVAAFRRGNGTLVLSTLRFRTFYGRYGRNIRHVLRTMLNNLGCATSQAEKVYEQEPLDISRHMNRNLWRDPKYRRADGTFAPEGWFGDDNDFRYFPVNLCGWSTTANNFCPKGVFPPQPMLLAGKRFRIQDPETNGGKAVVWLDADEAVTLSFEHPVRADRFRLLGTAANFGKDSVLDVTVNGNTQSFNGEEHFGARWWAASRPKGLVAWAGETPKDPNAGLYAWLCSNPNPAKPVESLTLCNRQKRGGFVLLAVTAERELK